MEKREQREIIASNLRNLLKINKLTAIKVAQDLNLSYSTFGDWTRGRTSPNPSQLKAVADYFKISIGNLTSLPDDAQYVSDSEILDSKVRISINDIQTAIDGEKIYKSIKWEYVPKSLVGKDDCIGIKLNDNSMEPEYHKGDIIIARQVKYLNTNGDYLLESVGEDEFLPEFRFVRVINKENDIIITPLNIDNESNYLPERLNEIEYMKKYKNKYLIIRLIRDYK